MRDEGRRMKDAGEIMVVAGEVSGDMHAAKVVSALRRRLPGARFFGIGGDNMRAEGVDILYHVRDMAVTGLSEVLLRFPFFLRVYKDMVRRIRNRRPDLALFVDYPGFNLRLAGAAHKAGIRTAYYICPQVWAWHRSRVKKIAGAVDTLITIFPFEEDLFKGTGLNVKFAGHPLAGDARRGGGNSPSDLPWKGQCRVALLPGSRTNEVERLLPSFLSAAEFITAEKPESSFILAAASQEMEEIIRRKLKSAAERAPVEVVAGKTREVLRQAHGAILASGTATLEASLMKCPMVIAYRMAPLSYAVLRRLVRVEHMGMVNIVAGRRVCPELVQGEVTGRKLAEALGPLLQEGPERSRMVTELSRVNDALGGPGAEERAADAILEGMG
ncbi:MAG: lipid-A-disaccharide synthase [Kiritimatiellia bacterium]